MCATDMHWSNKRQLACLLYNPDRKVIVLFDGAYLRNDMTYEAETQLQLNTELLIRTYTPHRMPYSRVSFRKFNDTKYCMASPRQLTLPCVGLLTWEWRDTSSLVTKWYLRLYYIVHRHNLPRRALSSSHDKIEVVDNNVTLQFCLAAA